MHRLACNFGLETFLRGDSIAYIQGTIPHNVFLFFYRFFDSTEKEREREREKRHSFPSFPAFQGQFWPLKAAESGCGPFLSSLSLSLSLRCPFNARQGWVCSAIELVRTRKQITVIKLYHVFFFYIFRLSLEKLIIVDR